MIEKLYGEVIFNLRQYVNSVDRTNLEQTVLVEDFLKNIIKRLEFVTRNNSENKLLEQRMLAELKNYHGHFL